MTKVDKQFPEARNGGKELTKRAYGKFAVLEILPIIVVALATYLYIFVKMYQNVYFKLLDFIIYKLQLNEAGSFFFFKKKEVF